MSNHWNPPVLHRGKVASVGGIFTQLQLLPKPKTYAPHKVWKGSFMGEIKYKPMPKKQRVRLWHAARDFERQTRQPGRQDGRLGRNGLAVLHALLFDFLNERTGRLDPPRSKIASKACISLRSVARGLNNLKIAGVLTWVKRCYDRWVDGRYEILQGSNAYGVCPATNWRGYVAPPEPPQPDSSAWGAHPPLPDVITLATRESTIAGMISALESDDNDPLARALARLGHAVS